MLVSYSYLMTGWWSSLIPLTTLAPEDVTTATLNMTKLTGALQMARAFAPLARRPR
jgi:hypothetical protein